MLAKDFYDDLPVSYIFGGFYRAGDDSISMAEYYYWLGEDDGIMKYDEYVMQTTGAVVVPKDSEDVKKLFKNATQNRASDGSYALLLVEASEASNMVKYSSAGTPMFDVVYVSAEDLPLAQKLYDEYNFVKQ